MGEGRSESGQWRLFNVQERLLNGELADPNCRNASVAGFAEGFGAVAARANAAEMIVAVDAGGVAVSKADLDGIMAHLRGGLRPGFGLKHGQHG
jgi:hypothetical protein